MAISLLTFANGDTNYVSKFNTNFATIQTAINQLQTAVGSFASVTNIAFLYRALFGTTVRVIDNDSLVGSITGSAGAQSLELSSGWVWLPGINAVSYAGTTVSIDFTGLPNGTYYVTLDASGAMIRGDAGVAITDAIYSVVNTAGTLSSLTKLATNAFHNTSPLAVSYGGTGLTTITTRGIMYGNGTSAVGVTAAGTTGQILRAVTSSPPAWTTATYPATVTVNRLLYAAGTNVIGDLATANNGVLVTSAGGVPSISSTLPTAVMTSITAVGTVTTGVWNATAIAAAYGGTGQTSYTIGDMLYASASGATALSKLAAVATGNVLLSGGVATAPAWGQITNSHIDTSAAIAVSKLAALTASRIVSSDASGFLTVNAALTSGRIPVANGTGSFEDFAGWTLTSSTLGVPSGGVLSFNGDVTITHSSALPGGSGLTVATGGGGFGLDRLNAQRFDLVASPTLPTSVSSSAIIAGGDAANYSGQIIIGDGAAWAFNIGKRTGAVTTFLFQFMDTGVFRPYANDGATLGSATLSWSDLFLASGAVINFNNGNAVITHSAAALSFGFSSGSFVVSEPSASVCRIAPSNGSVSLRIEADGGNSLANIYTSSAHSLYFGSNGGNHMFIPTDGSVVIGGSGSALATDATGGFLYVPTCAGAPSGTPTTRSGTCALVFDTTNNRLYVYDGGWLMVALA